MLQKQQPYNLCDDSWLLTLICKCFTNKAFTWSLKCILPWNSLNLEEPFFKQISLAFCRCVRSAWSGWEHYNQVGCDAVECRWLYGKRSTAVCLKLGPIQCMPLSLHKSTSASSFLHERIPWKESFIRKYNCCAMPYVFSIFCRFTQLVTMCYIIFLY